MDKEHIKSASNKLELIDICLHEAILERGGEEDPLLIPSEFQQQSKIAVTTEDITYAGQDDKDIDILRIYVSLGHRSVDDTNQNNEEVKKEPIILFKIEASFRVDYHRKGKISKEAVKEFANNNAVHNVWPFWRQYVFQTIQQACLPHVDIPLLRLKIPQKDIETGSKSSKRGKTRKN